MTTASTSGLTFQIVDDVLDLTGREEVIGKPVASDLREGKMTLPLIHALRHAAPDFRERVSDIVRERQVSAAEWQEVLAVLAEHRSLDYAFRKAGDYARQAQDTLLAAFPPSAERDALAALPEYVLSRDR